MLGQESSPVRWNQCHQHLLDETASSEDIYIGASDEKAPSKDTPATTYAPASEKTNETKCEEELTPPTLPLSETALSKNISVLTDSPATASATAPIAVPAAATVQPALTMPPVSETASSSATIDKPLNPTLELSEDLRFSDETNSEVKLAPMTSLVSKTAPPEDSPAPASAPLLPVAPDVKERLEAFVEKGIVIADAASPKQKYLQQMMKTHTNTLDTGTPVSRSEKENVKNDLMKKYAEYAEYHNK
jgi:hypothetical protein